MEIGAAKPSAAERARVPHHLLDVRDPSDPFTAGDFVEATAAAIREIHGRGKRALVVGGTGFYLKALLFGTWAAGKPDAAFRASLEGVDSAELLRRLDTADPKAALRIQARDRYRLVRALEVIHQTGRTPSELEAEVPSTPVEGLFLWVVERADGELRDRIRSRSESMVNGGLLDEVNSLRARWPGARPLSAVGYAQAVDFLEGRKPEGRQVAPGICGLTDEISLATRQLVKQQRTWFKNLRTRLPDGRMGSFVLDRDRGNLSAAFAQLYGES
jgi:tRNA dimethylallyltransferase